MKLTRLCSGGALLAAAACAVLAPAPRPPHLVVRAPKMPVSESMPASSRPEDPVQAAVFDRINENRAAAGLSPVAWDPGAAKVGEAYTAAQVAEGTTGHFLTDGFPPYARTAFAGVFGMGSENAVAWHTTAPAFTDSATALALEGHADMLGEKPPNDGHRKTILDPQVTHVGIGYAMHRGSFRMVEEFQTRRLAELALDAEGGSVSVRGRTLAGWTLHFVTIAREPTPKPLTKDQARSRTTYTYPEPSIAFVPEGNKSMRVVGAETEDRIRVGPTGEFAFRFAPPQDGLWIFVFYVGEGRPRPRPGGLAVVWIEAEKSR